MYWNKNSSVDKNLIQSLLTEDATYLIKTLNSMFK
jgi:hypothetical protein